MMAFPLNFFPTRLSFFNVSAVVFQCLECVQLRIERKVCALRALTIFSRSKMSREKNDFTITLVILIEQQTAVYVTSFNLMLA